MKTVEVKGEKFDIFTNRLNTIRLVLSQRFSTGVRNEPTLVLEKRGVDALGGEMWTKVATGVAGSHGAGTRFFADDKVEFGYVADLLLQIICDPVASCGSRRNENESKRTEKETRQ